MVINEKTLQITVDTAKCQACESKACVAACKKYARGMLKLEDGHPSVSHLTEAEVLRLGTECLSCEFACHFDGNKALSIEVPVVGLDEYMAKRYPDWQAN